MDYSQFLLLKEELSLILVIVILFVADLFMSPDAHKNDGKPVLNTMLPVALLTIHTLITIVPGPVADAFGGMYHNQPIQSIVKSILSIGTLIVFLMAHEWMRRPDTAIKQGEFYILTLSTLLGMYFMISAGHFLMFFIGLETASISKGSAAFVLMAILIKVFAPMVEQWQEVLYWVIIASITIANLFALRQQNLKRLMAFSSISQAGYIMLGVISGSAQGMTSLVYYVLIYMFANLAVFTVITIVALRAGKFTLEDYNGLYTTNPKLAFLMTLALFSLAGIPPFALINTIISLYYYLKIVKAMYINKSDEPIAAFRSDNYTRASLAICTLGIVVLSIASVVYQSIDKFSFGL